MTPTRKNALMQRMNRMSLLAMLVAPACFATSTASSSNSPDRPAPGAFLAMLHDLVVVPTKKLDPTTAAKAFKVEPGRFKHIDPTGSDDPGGDVLGLDQGWYLYLVLPYADATKTMQGARLMFTDQWPVKRSTSLLMCLDAADVKATVIAAGWTYLNKSTDYGGLPWRGPIVDRFKRSLGGANEMIHVFHLAQAEDDYDHGCIFDLEIIPEGGGERHHSLLISDRFCDDF